jgi:hypothetical protein
VGTNPFSCILLFQIESHAAGGISCSQRHLEVYVQSVNSLNVMTADRNRNTIDRHSGRHERSGPRFLVAAIRQASDEAVATGTPPPRSQSCFRTFRSRNE